jgi:surface carbohydrate biosynthesis protein (TIGR04326 family)
LTNPAERLVLIDGIVESVPDGRCVADWSSREPRAGVVSVPLAVDAAGPELRDEYVAWTNDLGATLIAGRSIRSRLAFWPDFSFWWMGLIPEKEPLKSPGIYVVFKLRTIERLYRERDCRGILYLGVDRDVDRTLRAWCGRLGHPYSRGQIRHARIARRHRVTSTLPWVIQGLGYLLLKCWRYRQARGGLRQGSPRTTTTTVITYFPNVDLGRTKAGRFWSRYWEQLHDFLDNAPGAVDWLWLYVDSDQVSFREAIHLRDVCNAAQPEKHRYYLLEEFANPAIVARAVRTYARACASAIRLRAARSAFRMPGSELNFFPILARDWSSSLCGIAAMDAALLVELFDAAARRLGPSVWTLFLWENQPWEHAAIVAWRRRQNTKLVGVQHATLPPLDLRAFVDARELEASTNERRPIPDALAVNGSGALDVMRAAGFPADRLIETEALRYSHLLTLRKAADIGESTLLIVTGYARSEALYQLRLVDEVAKRGALASYRRVFIKPHPLRAVEPLIAELGLTFSHEIVKQPLVALWPTTTAAFVANSTSAIAEALYLGVPTAVCAPADEMNLSPAFGRSEVPMVSTVDTLDDFLRQPSRASWPPDYLLIEEGLPRWRKLLTA